MVYVAAVPTGAQVAVVAGVSPIAGATSLHASSGIKMTWPMEMKFTSVMFLLTKAIAATVLPSAVAMAPRVSPETTVCSPTIAHGSVVFSRREREEEVSVGLIVKAETRGRKAAASLRNCMVMWFVGKRVCGDGVKEIMIGFEGLF